MKYTEEMILQSESGYCMPFEERKGKDVKLSLGYGEQTVRQRAKHIFIMASTSMYGATRWRLSPAVSCQV